MSAHIQRTGHASLHEVEAPAIKIKKEPKAKAKDKKGAKPKEKAGKAPDPMVVLALEKVQFEFNFKYDQHMSHHEINVKCTTYHLKLGEDSPRSLDTLADTSKPVPLYREATDRIDRQSDRQGLRQYWAGHRASPT